MSKGKDNLHRKIHFISNISAGIYAILNHLSRAALPNKYDMSHTSKFNNFSRYIKKIKRQQVKLI